MAAILSGGESPTKLEHMSNFSVSTAPADGLAPLGHLQA